MNKSFTASGRLEVTLTRGWEQHPVLSHRDSGKSTEEERRTVIRKERWEEVKKEAFVRVAYQRNAERLRDDLTRRDSAAAMRAYADEITAHAAGLEEFDAQAAREWADWICYQCREHRPAERPTAPRGGRLLQPRRTPAAHAWLEHLRAAPALGLHGMSLGHPTADLA